MCCHQTTQLGRLDEKTNVLDLWNSHLAKEIRDFTTKGNLHPVCSSWNSCPFMVGEKWDYYSKKFDELPPPVEDSRPTTPEHPHEANLVQLDLNP